MSQNKKDQAKQAAAEDGVENPSGIAIGAFSAAYLAFIPVTSYLARTGVFTNLVEGTARFVPGYATGSGRTIPAIATLYVFWTFGASGALSAAGQAMGRKEGLDTSQPRKFVSQLSGLPLRLFSAHQALMENFAAFALAAALAQYLAPANQEIVNLVSYHAIAKLFIHYPSYLFDFAPTRTLSHISANAAMINVLWRLAAGAS